jgi:hypothetical protein
MKLHVARQIGLVARLFLNSDSWGCAARYVTQPRVLEARRILRRRYGTCLRNGTHVVKDGRLIECKRKG